MDKTEIINLIKNNLIEIIPEMEDEEIDINLALDDMGANSLDKAELIAITLENLELEVSRIEFVSAKSINDLASLMDKCSNS